MEADDAVPETPPEAPAVEPEVEIEAEPSGGEDATPPEPEPEAEPVVTDDEGEEGITAAGGLTAPWSGVLAVEGVETGDNRFINPGALTARTLPLPLMCCLSSTFGHDGAVMVGRIDSIMRAGNSIVGSGVLDLGSAAGQEVHRQLGANPGGEVFLRGVSVDLDETEIDFIDHGDSYQIVLTAGRLMGATCTYFPAFQEAAITLAADDPAMAASGATVRIVTPFDDMGEPLVASGASTRFPVAPPASWFALPATRERTPVRIDAEGRLSGYAWTWDTCHTGRADRCTRAPHSATGYRNYLLGSTMTAEGAPVATGIVIMDTVHPDLRQAAGTAQAFYADTGCAVGDVVVYEDEVGGYVTGAARPELTAAQVRAFNSSAGLSGDWRPFANGGLELCALLTVNQPGFPVALAASGADENPILPGITMARLDPTTGEALALVASGVPCDDSPDAVRLVAMEARLAELETGFSTLAAQMRPIRAERALAVFGR